MELKEIYLLLTRKKFYLILVPSVTAIIMFIARFSSDRQYVSESQLSTGLTITQSAFGESVRLSPYAIAVEFSNLIETIRSKRVTSRLGYQLLLHDLSVDEPFREPEFEDEEDIPTPEQMVGIEDTLVQAIDEFILFNRSTEAGKTINALMAAYGYDQLSILDESVVYRKGDSDFINVQHTCEDPWLAAFIVNTWANTTAEYYNFMNASRQSGSLVALRQIRDKKQEKLNEAVARLNRFRATNQIMVTSSEDESVSERLDEYRKAVSDEESNARRLQLTLENLRGKIADQNTNTPSNNRNEITNLNRKISGLSDRLFSEPDNSEIRRQLDEARSDLQEAMYKYNSSSNTKLDELFEEENSLEVELSVSLDRVKRLKNDYSLALREVRSSTSQASTLGILEAEVTSGREEYLSAEQEYGDAVSQYTMGGSLIRLSYEGDIPDEPEPRGTVLFTALGFVSGFLTTVFLMIAVEFFDNRIKNPSKFKRVIGNDPIGIVGYYKNYKFDFADIIQGKFSGLDADEADSFLRNLRKIRFEIESHSQSVFLFTSLGKGSGKSFLLSSLAYSLSLADRRVLIIDTNFRDNSISKSYNKYMAEHDIVSSGLDKWAKEFSNRASKSTASKKVDSQNEGENDEFMNANFITKTVNKNIDLIISRNFNDSPLEIFSKAKLDESLEHYLKNYDFVFMEGAALNFYSDSKELSRYSSVIIPVYSIDDKLESTSKTSIKFIEENSKNEVKMLLNKVWPEDLGEA